MRDHEVSARFLNRQGGVNRWVTEVMWTNDGTTWLPARLVSGTVSRSLSDQIHWHCSLELAGVEVGSDGINPFNTRVRVRHGLEFGPGDFELIPFGMFRISSASSSATSPTVSVEGESFESFVIRAKLLKPTTFYGATADTMITKIVRDVMGTASSVQWDDRIIDKRDTVFRTATVEQERWDLIDGQGSSGSVAAAIAGRVIADADGGFRVIPVPTLEDDPVAEIVGGRGGALVNHTQELASDEVFNIVVASGSSVEGVSVRAIVQDTDVDSPTYVKRSIAAGGFGPCVMYYDSPLLDTDNKAYDAARAKLAEHLGFRQQITIDQPHWPLYEPGDVVRVAEAPTILDAITYDLTGAPLQADTRSQRATFAGEYWSEPEEETDGESDDYSGESAEV